MYGPTYSPPPGRTAQQLVDGFTSTIIARLLDITVKPIFFDDDELVRHQALECLIGLLNSHAETIVRAATPCYLLLLDFMRPMLMHEPAQTNTGRSTGERRCDEAGRVAGR